MSTHVGTGLVSRASLTPSLQGIGVRALPKLGFLSIYVYTLCRRTTKFDVITCGEGLP